VQALGASGPHRPVDEADTDDDAADDADRGDGEGEIGSLGEAEILHDAPHAGRGAVPALETELDEGADHGAGTEEGDEDGGGEGEATWRSFLIDAMAKQAVKAGGIGLADTVMSEMLKMQEQPA